MADVHMSGHVHKYWNSNLRHRMASGGYEQEPLEMRRGSRHTKDNWMDLPGQMVASSVYPTNQAVDG